jgi:hypothetical protein
MLDRSQTSFNQTKESDHGQHKNKEIEEVRPEVRRRTDDAFLGQATKSRRESAFRALRSAFCSVALYSLSFPRPAGKRRTLPVN